MAGSALSASSYSESAQTIGYSGIIGSIGRNFIVGVNYWKGTTEQEFLNRDLYLLNDIGIKSVKLGAVYNSGPENNLVQYDTLVALLSSKGFEVIGMFHQKDGVQDLNKWGDYVYEMARHFKGKIRYWVVWNEPNWNPSTQREWFTPREYIDILKAAYIRAKAADPDCLVLTGTILTVEDGWKFLRGMYENGAKGFFDAVAVNPYCYPASPLQPNEGWDGFTFWNLPAIRNLMVEYGDSDKEIWITEFGYRTPGGSEWRYTITEQQQALYLLQALRLATTWDWIGRFYIFEWMDSSVIGNWGLIREKYDLPFQTKPAFDAIKAFILTR